MTRFIDERRGRFRSSSCAAPLGHPRRPTTRHAADLPRPRAISDAGSPRRSQRILEANYGVYGARKVWRQLRREGIEIGRDRVWRLMREAGLHGARRGQAQVHARAVMTGGPRPPDLVERDFCAAKPNRALGRRLHLRQDLGRVLLRRLRRGRVLPDDRRVVARTRTCGPRSRPRRSRWRSGSVRRPPSRG